MSTVDSSTSRNRTPALHVDEVVEKSFVARHARGARALRRIPEEAKRRQRQVARLGARAPAALHPDRIGRQREADRGDAREARRRPAVRHQSVLAVRCIPEPAEGPPLDLLIELRNSGQVWSSNWPRGGAVASSDDVPAMNIRRSTRISSRDLRHRCSIARPAPAREVRPRDPIGRRAARAGGRRRVRRARRSAPEPSSGRCGAPAECRRSRRPRHLRAPEGRPRGAPGSRRSPYCRSPRRSHRTRALAEQCGDGRLA